MRREQIAPPDSPEQTVAKLTGPVYGHHARLRAAWDASSPDVTLPGREYGHGRPSGGSPSDPTGKAAWYVATLRVRAGQDTAARCLELGTLLAGRARVAVELDTMERLAAIASTPLPDLPTPGCDLLEQLTGLHRRWWDRLRTQIDELAADPKGWDLSRMLSIDARQVERDLHGTSRRAYTDLVRPIADEARTQRRCRDPYERGCDRMLAEDRDGRGATRSAACRTHGVRARRRALESDAAGQ